MKDETFIRRLWADILVHRRRALMAAMLAVLVVVAILSLTARQNADNTKTDPASSAQAKQQPGVFYPTPNQWATLTVEPVKQFSFRSELVTDGKIAVDEDHSTPVFSPYSGRVTRITAKPGDIIQRGQLLFALEATDMVQAQNDFITAVAGLETAQSQLNLAQINEKRQHDLYDAKAVPLKDWQAAQNDLIAAQSNTRAAEIALEAVRNRLRILQKTEEEIANFQKTGKINPETPIYAPINGAVVQRKVGPGQYITAGASDPAGDPVFVIGDPETVWLVANVRETDTPKIKTGQTVEFRVVSHPDQIFTAKLNFVAETMDPATRRLTVRATVNNPGKLLKPEMFASVSIFTREDEMSPAVPREAIVYEGDMIHVWVVTDQKAVELRSIKLGLTNGNMVQVLSGLAPGEKVITKGSLFIDRAATGGES